MFQSRHPQQSADVKGKGKAEPGPGEDPAKKVTFADDTKPPAAAAGAPPEKTEEPPKVDGVVGQLEIYESGAVKMRMSNGIVLDVCLSVHSICLVVTQSDYFTGYSSYTTVLPATRCLHRSNQQTTMRTRRSQPSIRRYTGPRYSPISHGNCGPPSIFRARRGTPHYGPDLTS